MHKSLLAILAAAALSASASPYARPSSTCSHDPAKYIAKASPLGQYYDAYKGDRDASILQLLRSDRRFSKLVTALSRAGGSLRDDLDDPNAKHKITLLSPTDEAFEVLEKMHGKTVETMDQAMLQKILQYHVIPESSSSSGQDRFYGHGKVKPYAKGSGKYHYYPSKYDNNDVYDYEESKYEEGKRAYTSYYNKGAHFYSGGGGLKKEHLCDGETLETALVEKRLGDSHEVGNRQRVRVTKYSGKVILNMYAMVIDSDMEASNGIVHALADVLILPEQLFTGISSLPSMFSTQALALKLTGLDKRVNEERGVTALVPSNAAYQSMGFFKNMEMFHPSNREELKSFLEKHYISEPLYVNEIIEDEYMKTRSRAAATCLAAKRGDHAYFERLRRDQNNGKAGNRDDDDEDVIEREYETWSGDKVVLRVECTEGGIDVLFDNTVVALADIPSANGVVQILTQPIENHTQHEGDDDDEGRRGYAYGKFAGKRGPKYAKSIEYASGKYYASPKSFEYSGEEAFGDKYDAYRKHGKRGNHQGKRRPRFFESNYYEQPAGEHAYAFGGKHGYAFGAAFAAQQQQQQQPFFFPGAYF